MTYILEAKNIFSVNPKLGLEHTAYRILIDNKTYWIDCPSCFDQSLPPMDVIMFTHFHFLEASNQFREHFSSSVRINDADSDRIIKALKRFKPTNVRNISLWMIKYSFLLENQVKKM